MKNRNIIYFVIIFLLGIAFVGGTYAFFSVQANMIGTNYTAISKCFLMDYNINNGDGTQNITGTLIPSADANGGINGRVGLKTNSSCDLNGIGVLKLHINGNDTTSSHLTEIAVSHCEDKKTGDVLNNYETKSACTSANQRWKEYPTSYCENKITLQLLDNYVTEDSCINNGGTWITGANQKSPLKYAVYNSSAASAIPVRVGKIFADDIGNDVVIYDNFVVEAVEKYFYVSIWLDGNLTDDTYDDLSFSGNITATVEQTDKLVVDEDVYEITKIEVDDQKIMATVINSKHVITDYAIINQNRGITTWSDIPSIEIKHILPINQTNVYNLVDNETVQSVGTYDVWFRATDGSVVHRSISITHVDDTPPLCSFGPFSKTNIARDELATITLTCTDTISKLTVNAIMPGDLIVSGDNSIEITSVVKSEITDGYQYVITVKGTENNGIATVLLPANMVKNSTNIGNDAVTAQTSVKTAIDLSSAIVTLSQDAYIYSGSAQVPTVTVVKNNTTLTENVDYVLEYSNNINVGKASVKVTGINEYAGTVTKTFTISYNTYTVTFASTTNCPLGNDYKNVNTAYNSIFYKANPSCVGYTFSGWMATNLNGSTAMYGNNGSNVTIPWTDGNNRITGVYFKNLTMVQNGTVTLTAIWTPNTYSISYSCNNGNCNGPITGTYDAVLEINNPTKTVTITGNVNGTGATVGAPTVAAQTFAGWTSTNLGSNAKSGSTNSTMESWTGSSTTNSYFKNLMEYGSVTLVANWAPTVVQLPTLSKNGYRCSWYSTSGTTGGTEVGASGANYTLVPTTNTNISLYARCTIATKLEMAELVDEDDYFYYYDYGYGTSVPIGNLHFLSTPFRKYQIESITFSNSLEGHAPNGTDCFDVGEVKDGTVLAWSADDNNNDIYEITIGSDGGVKANANSNGLFGNLINLASINNIENFDVSTAKNISEIFYGTKNLKGSLDLSNWDVSNVTNFWYVFGGTGLTELNLRNWNVSKAGTSFYGTFSGASSLANLDVSNWNTTNVTYLRRMFTYTYNLKNLDLSSWNTSKVTTIDEMFTNSGIVNLNVSTWDTSNVMYFSSTFVDAKNLVNLDVSNWNTAKVRNMNNMFRNTISLKNLDVSNWNTVMANNLDGMFSGAKSITSLNVSGWNTANVVNMGSMFSQCTNLTSLDLSNWDTSKVTSMSSMFSGAVNLSSVEGISNFNMANVKSVTYMFNGTSIPALNLSKWNTSKFTSLYGMFSCMTNLTDINLNGWNTGNVTSLSYMFNGSYRLKTLNLNGLNVVKVTDMYSVFANMYSLENLNVSGWNTINVKVMNTMFANTFALKTLNLNDWKVTNVINALNMFNGTAVKNLYMDNWNFANAVNISTMFSAANFENLSMNNFVLAKATSFPLNSKTKLKTVNAVNCSFNSITSLASMFSGDSQLTTLNISGWNMPKVTSLALIFANTYNLKVINMNNWNSVNVTNINSMFLNTNNMTTLNADGWNITKITSTLNMLSNKLKLTTVNLRNFNTSSLTSTASMFYNSNNLTTLNLAGLKAPNVTNMASMFYNTAKLSTLDISGWNAPKVTTMSSMFQGTSNLTTVDVSVLNTANVTSMFQMFYGTGATSLDLSSWNTLKVTTIRNMFFNANKLVTLNLGGWNTINVTNMYGLFNNAVNLTTVYVGSSWNTNKVSYATNMFYNVLKIKGGAGTTYKSAQASNKTYARIDGGTSAPGYFTEAAAAKGASGFNGASLSKSENVYKANVSINVLYDDLRECNNNCGTTCLNSDGNYGCPTYSCSDGILSGTQCYVYEK